MNSLFKRITKPFSLYLFTSILLSVFKIFTTVLEGYAIDAIVNKSTLIALDPFITFVIFIAMVAFVHIVDAFSTYFYYIVQNKFTFYIAKAVSKKFYNQFFKANNNGVKKYSSEQAFNNVLNNSSNILNNSVAPLVNVITALISFLLIFGYFAYTNWIVSLVILGVFILSIIPNAAFFKKVEYYVFESQKDLNKLTDNLAYWLERYSVLYFMNKEDKLYNFVEKNVLDYYLKAYKLEKIEIYKNNLSSSFIDIGKVVGLILLGTLFFNSSYNITFGTIYIFIKTIDLSKDEFLSLVQNFVLVVASKKLYSLLQLNLKNETVNEKLSAIENIKINNLNFAYDSKQIIKNFSYEFNKGKKYALIGQSGSGKTTLVTTLLNENQNYNGEILINDINLKNYSTRNLLKRISYQGPESFVFDIDLKSNIDLFETNEDKLNNVLKFVELDKELKEKINDKKFDCYNELSLGQKQRVSLARLFYFDKEFIILDEALANLNKDLAKKILDKILKLDKTIIYISHHLDNDDLKKFDGIINLNKNMSKSKLENKKV